MEEKIKQNRGGCEVGDTMKMMRKSPVMRRKIPQAAARSNGRAEVSSVDCNARRGLRSSSSLSVVAIQAKDIFIRGCYL